MELEQFFSRQKEEIFVKFRFFCTNNIAEYEALSHKRFFEALDLRIKGIDVYGDSSLSFFQTTGDWKTKDQKLISYHQYLPDISLK